MFGCLKCSPDIFLWHFNVPSEEMSQGRDVKAQPFDYEGVPTTLLGRSVTLLCTNVAYFCETNANFFIINLKISRKNGF